MCQQLSHLGTMWVVSAYGSHPRATIPRGYLTVRFPADAPVREKILHPSLIRAASITWHQERSTILPVLSIINGATG